MSRGELSEHDKETVDRTVAAIIGKALGATDENIDRALNPRCPKCGKNCETHHDMGEYTVSRWQLTHFVCPEHGIVETKEGWL